MRRALNIFALTSCLLFLVGNITYDMLPGEPDYRIFYIPLSLMIFALILLCKESEKLQGGVIAAFWWFFYWLSIGQLVKFLLFNPFLQMASDYGFLGLTLIGLAYKLYKNARPSAGTK